MKTNTIGYHSQTPQGEISIGRMGSRPVRPQVSQRSSVITRIGLTFLSLITRASAQFTGTYYPEAAASLGAGSNPLLISGGEAAQLLFSNDAGLHVGLLNPLGTLEPFPTQVDNRTGLLHSKHVATYEDGRYALTLEAYNESFHAVEACQYGSGWELIKCIPIYSVASSYPFRPDSDIATSSNTTMVTFQEKITYCSPCYTTVKANIQLTQNFVQMGSNRLGILYTEGPEFDSSVTWLGDRYHVSVTTDYAYENRWSVQSREYSEEGTSLGNLTTIPGSGLVDNNNILNGGAPNLKLSNLGPFGYAESWESESPSPTGYCVHFVASDGTDLGTYNLNTSGNIRSGPFTEINSTMVAGAWSWDAASDNKVILELFQRIGNTVAAVSGSSFTVFQDPTNVFTSVSILALPNETALVVVAEKAGSIYTRVISFKPPTPAPTPVPTNQLTPLPLPLPPDTPTNPSDTPSPNGSGDTQGSTTSGTQEDASDEGTSTTSGHTFTVMTPAPLTPGTVTLIKKEDKAEENSLGLIIGVTVSAVVFSAIAAIVVARSRRRDSSPSFGEASGRPRRISSALHGRANHISPSSSTNRIHHSSRSRSKITNPIPDPERHISAPQPLSELYTPTLGSETPVRNPGIEMEKLASPSQPKYGKVPPPPDQTSTKINYDGFVPLTGYEPPRGYEDVTLALGGQQGSSAYERAKTPLKV